jgi:small subunit ribosomal protein S2
LGIVTMKELLEAGVHFGHQTRRWDPKMKQYIFTERNGIHIIDLQKTITLLKVAYNAIKELIKNGGIILFIGTKRQSQQAIVEEAERCGMPYVSNRWLGGMITNFETIKKSIMKLKRIERMEVDGTFDFMIKKEIIRLRREKEKLLKNLGGIKEMETLPDMVFIIDPKKEAIAVAEAMKKEIPIVAIVDTNCNPDGIDYPIPGNDDAIRAINLFASVVSSAVIEGQNEAGKIEITEDTKIMSLADEEKPEIEEKEEISTEIEEGVAIEENEEDLEEGIIEEKVLKDSAEEKSQKEKRKIAETEPEDAEEVSSSQEEKEKEEASSAQAHAEEGVSSGDEKDEVPSSPDETDEKEAEDKGVEQEESMETQGG